ncbi:MAG: hypothetical protein ACLQG3_16035 [Terracidiphilus sp.]
MHDIALQSGWETILLAAPLVGMVLVGVFRLDVIAAAPQRQAASRRPLSGTDENGHILFTDPDGRPWPDTETSK